MVYCFVHLDDAPEPVSGDEEVFLIVPDASKVAMAVPLDALAPFLTILDEAVRDLPLPQCPACGATMPSVAVCASPHNEPGHSG